MKLNQDLKLKGWKSKTKAREQAYTETAFPWTLGTLNAIHPENVTSCIHLYVVVLRRRPNSKFSKVKPITTTNQPKPRIYMSVKKEISIRIKTSTPASNQIDKTFSQN